MNHTEWIQISAALRIATESHAGQFRKYSENVPYINHPIRVSMRIAQLYPADTDAICAALLHDVLEDTPTPAVAIENACGKTVLDLVLALTNPSKQHPSLPRERRKEIDRQHAAQMSYNAMRIKLADRADNLRDTIMAPAEFRQLYSAESKLLMAVIGHASEPLKSDYIDALIRLDGMNMETKP